MLFADFYVKNINFNNFQISYFVLGIYNLARELDNIVRESIGESIDKILNKFRVFIQMVILCW